MDLVTLIYLASVAPRLTDLSMALGIVGLLLVGGVKFFHAMELIPTPPLRRYVVACVVLILFGAALPSERAIYLMVGAYAGQDFVASETGQDMLVQIQTLVMQRLEELAEAE